MRGITVQLPRTHAPNTTSISAPHLSRREFLGAGASFLFAHSLSSCTAARHIEVLAPPSTLRPELLRRFEEQSGIQVRPGSWVSPTDALGKLFSSSAHPDMMIVLSDLFTPVIPQAIARGLLAPIDAAVIPQAEHIAAPFASDMFRIDGKVYTIPVYWGYDTVLYNQAKIPSSEPLLDSWGLIFDDRFRGKVSLKDDAHESIMPTALYLGHPRPLEMDRSDLKEVTRFLIRKKDNFRSLWTRFAEAVQLMATGEVNALYGYPLMLHTLRQQGMNVAANLPREGVLLFVQSAFIPRPAARPDDAVEWLKFLLREDTAVELTERAAVLSPSELVRRHFSAAQQRAYGYDVLNGSAPLVRLGRPKHLDLWIEAWAQFKAA